MNQTLLFFLIMAIVGGIIQGLYAMNKVKKNPSLGVRPSRNLFTFLFVDKY